MLDTQTRSAIRRAIRYNEIGDASPYCLSFAGKGNSGASFGVYQGDTHANQPRVSDLLYKVLLAAGAPDTTAERITKLLSPPCLENPLGPSDTAFVNAALASAAGKAMVDAMDSELEQAVLEGIDMCLQAGEGRGVGMELAATLYCACWTNMSGVPRQLSNWISGKTVYGLAPPHEPGVCARDMEDYLRRTDYFAKHPKNFSHLQESVRLAML